MNTPAQLRKLLEALQNADAMHTIELVGQKGSDDEAIRGIVECVPRNQGPIPMQIGP